jgi:hypothetical protein
MKAQKFTNTRKITIHGTQPLCGCVCVCMGAWVVVKYVLYQCLLGTLFQIMQVSNASRKLNVAVPKINHNILSKEEILSIH